MKRGGCRWWFALLLLAWVGEARARADGAVGWVLPPANEWDQALLRGATMNAGGLLLRVRGTLGQWGTLGEDAALLVTEERCGVLVTPRDSVATHLVLQVAGRTRTPVISLCPDDAVLEAGLPWCVRLVPSTRAQAELVLSMGTNWLFVVPAGRAGREMRLDLQRAATRMGDVRLTFSEAPLKQAPPRAIDAVGLWVEPPDAAIAARFLRGWGFQGVLTGPGHLQCDEFLRTAGDSCRGIVLSATVTDAKASSERRIFADRCREQTGVNPGEAEYWGADVMRLAEVIGGRAPAGRWHEAFPLKDAGRGLTGPWVFGERGDRQIGLTRVRWNGTEWEGAAP